jgi:NADH dehydrogenase FAD-containing subunit
MKKNGTGLLLDRILEPVSASLNEEAAQKLIALNVDRKTQARVTKLADKCNEGELIADERHEYEMYVMANHFVAILKVKARILLARKSRRA